MNGLKYPDFKSIQDLISLPIAIRENLIGWVLDN